MRIDPSRIRIISRYEASGFGCVGLVLGLGSYDFDVFGLSARSEAMMGAWADGRLEGGSDDEAEVLGWLQEQFLTEELPKLSGHQRIAMVRDGLLIP